MFYKIFNLVTMLLAVAILVVVHSQDLPPEIDVNLLNKAKRIKEILRKKDVDIEFYGLVIDQSGNAVSGAAVSMRVSFFYESKSGPPTAVKSISVKTGNDGSFKVDGVRGSSLYVKEIKRDGYSFNPKGGNEIFYFNYSKDLKPFIPDSHNPVMFKLRKQIAATFLVANDFWEWMIKIGADPVSCRYDFIEKRSISVPATRLQDTDSLSGDLLLKAHPGKNGWEASFSVPGTRGGIIQSEECWYEAPDDGYQGEIRFILEDRKIVTGPYLYIRSRDPSIYTRIHITSMDIGDGRIRITGKILTNPYGERSFDEIKSLDFEISQQLNDEAIRALQNKKYPTKPDFKSLLDGKK